jgi:hypothetical protein
MQPGRGGAPRPLRHHALPPCPPPHARVLHTWGPVVDAIASAPLLTGHCAGEVWLCGVTCAVLLAQRGSDDAAARDAAARLHSVLPLLVCASFPSAALRGVLRDLIVAPPTAAAEGGTDALPVCPPMRNPAAIHAAVAQAGEQGSAAAGALVACLAALVQHDSLRVAHEDDVAAWAMDTVCELWWQHDAAAAPLAPAQLSGLPTEVRRQVSATLVSSVRWEYTSDWALTGAGCALRVLASAQAAAAAPPGDMAAPTSSPIVGLLSPGGVVMPVGSLPGTAHPTRGVDGLAAIGIPLSLLQAAERQHAAAGLVASAASAVALGLRPPRLGYSARCRPMLPPVPASSAAGSAGLSLAASSPLRELQRDGSALVLRTARDAPAVIVDTAALPPGAGDDPVSAPGAVAPPPPALEPPAIVFGRHAVAVDWPHLTALPARLLLTDAPHVAPHDGPATDDGLRAGGDGTRAHRDDHPAAALLRLHARDGGGAAADAGLPPPTPLITATVAPRLPPMPDL